MNINEENQMVEDFKGRLCPDILNLEEVYKLMNGINNNNERVSIHYEIHKC